MKDYRYKPSTKGIHADGLNGEGLRICYIPQPRCKRCGIFIKLNVGPHDNKMKQVKAKMYPLCEKCKNEYDKERRRMK